MEIRPGCEPWSVRNGDTGVLLLHGFTGSAMEMRPVAQALSTAGFSIELPLLPGHGTKIGDLLDRRWDDFAEAAESAYDELREDCDDVALVGLSLGGALTSWLAARHPEVRAMAVINPLIDPPGEDFLELLQNMAGAGVKILPGSITDHDLDEPPPWTYGSMPTLALRSILGSLPYVNRLLPDIACPVLIVTSDRDSIVDPVSSDVLANALPNRPEQLLLKNSPHTATMGDEAEALTERITNFLTDILPPAP